MIFLGVLITDGLNIWINAAFHFSITQISSTACRLLPFCTNTVFDFLSSIIVLMTFEKLFSIHSSIKLDSKKRCFSIIILFLISSTFNSHFLFTMALVEMHILDFSFILFKIFHQSKLFMLCPLIGLSTIWR